jgi:ABC-2 type transport system permease protein
MSLLSSEWARLQRRPLNRALAVGALAMLLLDVGFLVLRPAEAQPWTVFELSDLFWGRLIVVTLAVRTLMMVLAASLMASEHGFDTLKVLLARLPRRGPLLAAKLTLVLGVGTLSVVVLQAADTAALWTVASRLDVAHLLKPEVFSRLWAVAALNVVNVCFYSLIAFGIAVLTRSQVVAITSSLMLITLLGGAADVPSPRLALLLPPHHFDNLMGLSGIPLLLDSAQTAFEAEVPGWVSVLVLLGWVLAVLVPAFVVFERRDVSGAPG